MGVLDTYLTVGEELVEYGTPAATLTRGYEATSDPAKRDQEYLVSNGMRPGFDTTRASRRRKVDLGASGTFNVDLLNKTMGLLFKAAIGDAGVAVEDPDGFRFTSTPTGPSTSLTMLVHRGRVDSAGVLPKAYCGGRVASWELSQAVGGEAAVAKLALTMDFQKEVNDVAAATAVYPSGDWLYGWPDCVVTVDGNVVENWDLKLTGDNGLKLDRRRNRGSTDKKKPYREKVPVIGGSFMADYNDDTLYDLYTSGDIVPVVSTWTGPDGDGIVITQEACQFIGETPKVEPGSSSQSAPWVALSDDSTPAVVVDYFTADTAP